MKSASFHKGTVTCQVSGKLCPLDEATPVDLIRPSLQKTVREMAPQWDPHGYVSIEELNKARMKHVEDLLEGEQGELMELRKDVIRSLQQHEILARNVDADYERNVSFADRLSDKIAAFGGSWSFIILFLTTIIVWMVVNTFVVVGKPFDPYPFIFLNLVLSCVAALQAPVIMMSQNRQEQKDRLRGQNDYKVNLKAELEIRHLNEKIDTLLNDQWKHLLEIQQMQMEMIEGMAKVANGHVGRD